MDIQCQYCYAELEANEDFYGKTCDCPGCGKEINIPDPNSPDSNPPPPPSTLMKEACPFCSEEILTTSRRCPFCSKRLDEAETTAASKGGSVSRFLNIFKKK